ncbi:MAG TPA: hypothetical protein VNQ33_01760 [Acidimicrobiales bacterium]|nr:hypothetical protein [Acidimicrobiales bacterium]
MVSPRRLAVIVLLAAVAAFAAGCGVDPGDQAASSSSSGPSDRTTTTAPSKDLSPMERAMVDRAKDLYVKLGMDPDDADCLARGLVAAGAGEGQVDPTDTGAMMDIVNQCDIDMSELNDLGSENGITSMEDGLEFGLQSSLESGGLSKKEAECVASDFVDQYGTDVSAMQDREKVAALMEGCNVDPSKYGG